MDLLLETVTALASARTLDEVTRIVSNSARALTQADGVTFVLREDDNLPSPARAIPAAVLSAFLASEHASAAAAAGFQLFIEKPVQPLELVGQIAQLAGRTAIH